MKLNNVAIDKPVKRELLIIQCLTNIFQSKILYLTNCYNGENELKVVEQVKHD